MQNKFDTIESQACEDASTQQSLTDPQNQPLATSNRTVSLEEPHGQESATTPQVNDTLYHHPTSSSSERKSVATDTEEHHALLDITISPDSSFQDDKWYAESGKYPPVRIHTYSMVIIIIMKPSSLIKFNSRRINGKGSLNKHTGK